MHPQADEIEACSLAWMTAIGLCSDERQTSRVQATKAAQLVAGAFPEGDPDRVANVAQWNYLAFAFDDAWCDEEGAHVRPDDFVRQVGRVLWVIETLDVRLCGDDPYLFGFYDLARRHQALATPVQMRRWVEGNRLWLDGLVQMTIHRAQRIPLGVDEYLAIRLHEVGAGPFTEGCEFVYGPEVPGHEMDSPPVRAVTQAAWMVGALDNDRVSRYKELLGQQDDNNVIDVIQRAHGSTSEQASETAVALRDSIMLLFLRLREALMPRASAPLRSYLTGLGHMLRSNIDWSFDVPRYGTVWASDSRKATTRIEVSASVVDQPANTTLAPLPYPVIAWWWDQLTQTESARSTHQG